MFDYNSDHKTPKLNNPYKYQDAHLRPFVLLILSLQTNTQPFPGKRL